MGYLYPGKFQASWNLRLLDLSEESCPFFPDSNVTTDERLIFIFTSRREQITIFQFNVSAHSISSLWDYGDFDAPGVITLVFLPQFLPWALIQLKFLWAYSYNKGFPLSAPYILYYSFIVG